METQMNNPYPNKGILKIELTGATAVGKTTVSLLIAEALARVFEEQDLLISIKVSTRDYDRHSWQVQRVQLKERLASEGGLKLDLLEQVLIVDSRTNPDPDWIHSPVSILDQDHHVQPAL